MTRAILLAAALPLSSCAVVEHVQVLPIINPNTEDVSCCVVYAEIPPSTHLSASVTHSDESGTKVKLGAKFRF